MGQVVSWVCKTLSILYSFVTNTKAIIYDEQRVARVAPSEASENKRPEAKRVNSDANNERLRISCHEEPLITSSAFEPELQTIQSTRDMTPSIECPLPCENILSYTCDHNGGVITSEDGITIIVPKGAVRVKDKVTFYIAVDLSGPFTFTELQTDLVSSYYWIGVSKSYYFQKCVKVEIEHNGTCVPTYPVLHCCKEESLTMRPVDYQLKFFKQDDRQYCKFETHHFCSYCLADTYSKGNEYKGKRFAALDMTPSLNNNLYKKHISEKYFCMSLTRTEEFYNTIETSTRTQAQVESTPAMQKLLQPFSRMRYLQKYSPSSYSVSICDHNGGVVTSEDGAIKLSIPYGAIMDGHLVMFYFVTCLYAPFILRSCRQHDLASPYYWIGVSESYHFHKLIQVDIEHFAALTVACNPSHFQLLSCEDDDESFIMRPADYALSFSVQDGISWCTFHTDRFCSYCLSRKCTHAIITRTGAFFLKPKNFQSLDKFTVEVWFSFLISHCLKRNTELYTRKGMILDKDCSCTFDITYFREK